jgi:outer membrane protein assembly factor BamB
MVDLSAHNGRLLWEMELDGAVLSAPVTSQDLMIFGTDENYFYVLQEVL